MIPTQHTRGSNTPHSRMYVHTFLIAAFVRGLRCAATFMLHEATQHVKLLLYIELSGRVRGMSFWLDHHKQRSNIFGEPHMITRSNNEVVEKILGINQIAPAIHNPPESALSEPPQKRSTKHHQLRCAVSVSRAISALPPSLLPSGRKFRDRKKTKLKSTRITFDCAAVI